MRYIATVDQKICPTCGRANSPTRSTCKECRTSLSGVASEPVTKESPRPVGSPRPVHITGISIPFEDLVWLVFKLFLAGLLVSLLFAPLWILLALF